MKKTFILMLVILTATLSPARDFDAVSPSGHTLYCDVVPGGAMIVGWERPQDGALPVRLTIPPVVSAGGADIRVIAVGDSAFLHSAMLVSLNLPASVRSIGCCAFKGCIGLGSVTVPAGVESVGEEAFAFIPNVEYRGAVAGAPWGALNLNAYKEGHNYYSDSTKTHIVCCERDVSEATIPPTVTTIGDYAFYFCVGIGEVSVDSTVVAIGSSAFTKCLGMESAYFNARLNSQEDASYIFSQCNNLERLTIGPAVTAIPFRMCYKCTALKEIEVPDNVKEVHTDAFMGCTSLETAVLGKGVSRTGLSMFEGCTSLKYFAATDSLRSVNTFTFMGCRSLRDVVLGDNVETIGARAFYDCGSLDAVCLGKHLVGISEEAFRDCRSLEEIAIPVTVRNIYSRAFSGCVGVSRIACMSVTSPTMGQGVFDSIDTGVEVYVPCDSADSYRRDANWQRFDSIHGTGYYMVVTANDPRWGRAVVTRLPTCEDNTAVVEAFPAEGCRFVKWSNGKTDNPCQISYNGTGYAYRKAIFEPLVGVSEPEPEPGVRVYASHGNIVVDGARGERVVVYDLGGRQMTAPTSCTTCIIHLPPSIYLVKVGNRKAEKVILVGS